MSIPHSSIFGIQSPKFITTADETVLLENSQYDYNDISNRFIRHESIINKKITYSDYGDHWYFGITLNLFKYADPELSEGENYILMKDKFTEINNNLNASVLLYPHKDGQPFIDNYGNNVYWKLLSVFPIWIYSPKFPDRLKIKFETLKTSKIRPMIYLVDDKDIFLTDDLGQKIVSQELRER